MKKRQSGSITPFLALIFILLLAMIGTLFEAARVRTGKTIAMEAVNTATESVLSQYYLPLYEDYHLFFMERGIDTEQLEKEELLKSIQDYMLTTFDADNHLKGGKWGIYSDFYGLNLEKVELPKIVRAVENDGNILRVQAIEYSKYNSAGEILDSFSNQLKQVKSGQKASGIIEKKLETEESLAEVSSKILEIIELVEGVSCNQKKTAIAFGKGGGLRAESVFAKKFCPDTVTKAHVGVHHNAVWKLLKSQYETPVAVLEKIESTMNQMERDTKEIEQLSDEIEELQKETDSMEGGFEQKNSAITEEKQRVAQLKKEEKSIQEQLKDKDELEEEEIEVLITSLKEVQKERKSSENNLEKLTEELSKMEKSMEQSLEQEHQKRQEIQEKKDAQESNLTKVNSELQALVKQAKNIQQKTEEAVAVIPQLQKKQAQTQSKVEEYKNVFHNSKEELSTELEKGLSEDLTKLEQYVSQEKGKKSYVARIVNMKPILEKNMKVLKKVSAMSAIRVSLEDLQEFHKNKQEIKNIIKSFKNYHIDTLKFDYTTLKLKNNTKNPMDVMSSSLTHSVLDMVLPSGVKLSKKELKNPDYYYTTYKKAEQKNKKETDADYQKSIQKSQKEGYQSEITQSFGSFGNNTESETEQSQKFLEKMLFQQYCNEHFQGFTVGKEKRTSEKSVDTVSSKNSNTVLEYEQEYLLTGKAKDKDNLKAVVNKIIFIRTIMNFVYLMTDSGKKKMTYATAASLVGFTGLEPLVRLTQTLILLTWSYEEALVDAGALLAGKSIPVMKDKTTFLLSYQELFVMSKGLIQKKVAQIKESQSMLGVRYKDYIQIFSMLEPDHRKSYRAMDLIEGNVRLRNGNTFTFSRAVYGMDISADVSMKARFLRFPVVQNATKWTNQGWKFSIQQSHAY